VHFQGLGLPKILYKITKKVLVTTLILYAKAEFIGHTNINIDFILCSVKLEKEETYVRTLIAWKILNDVCQEELHLSL